MEQKNCFYRYTVKWFSPDEDYKEYNECGFVIGKTYTEACEKVAKYYGDGDLGYINLVCLTDGSCEILSDSEYLSQIKS